MSTGKLLRLQKKLNAIFVWRRDAGMAVDAAYSRLLTVERRLSAMHVYW